MLRVGLTGGLATGKTSVGNILVSLGCHLLKADELGHQVLLPGGEAYDAVVKEFGPSLVGPDGQILRRQLGQVVFADPAKLARLNALIHPLVIAREEAWIRSIAAQDDRAICVVEAAILIETGSYRRFQRMVLVVCEEEQQIERAMKRDGISREEALSRIRNQMPLSEKRKYAHYIIDTSGTLEATGHQVRAVYKSLLDDMK